MNKHQRPLWIILFAILLASIAIRAKGEGARTGAEGIQGQEVSETQRESFAHAASETGQAMTTMRIGGETFEVARASADEPVSEDLPAAGSGQVAAGSGQVAAPGSRSAQIHGKRPKYALVSAEPAQFDSDSDPDGWVARVLLMAEDAQPVVVDRATATFELMPRLPTQDFTGYVNANLNPITWSIPLTFAEDGTATARLKLRSRIRPLAGWSGTSHPAVGRAGGFYSSRRGIIRHTTPAFAARTAATDNQRRGGAIDTIGLASFGQLSIRVSVPGEGVFDAVTPVVLRPTVLVDTRWPYQ